ncbi:MAG TPA: hypothetical protein VFF40_08405 [Acidimicrobiia bacterium]|nr:hypothetical protein [Acidimicrobiia bacterium]
MSRITRTTALVALVGLIAAGCVPPGPPDNSPLIRIFAPGHATQAPTNGVIPLRIDLDEVLNPASIKVSVRGTDHVQRIGRRRRLTLTGNTYTATLGPADLVAGPLTLEVTAKFRTRPHRPRALSRTSFSWEPEIDAETAGRCDVTDQASCLLPFPNDHFTVDDPGTDTARRVSFDLASMPANSSGVHIDPTEWNRNDGFSPGTPILAFVPGLDSAASGIAPITDIGRSLDPDQAVVLVDAVTGERQPFFAELDAQADPEPGPVLIIRPARNLTEGHRFIVALRNLRDGETNTIAPSRGFRLYRDGIETYAPAVEARRAHMEDIFATLAAAGVERESLYLAWDFTVSSTRSLSERMLHIRDDAFASIGDAAPAFTVDSVQDDVDDRIYRRVTGTFTVPNYLTGAGEPGSRFNNGPDGLPARNGDQTASFICNIPRAASADGELPVDPARAGVYGHGLLGSNSEVNAGNVRSMSNEHNFMFCATKWTGFADEDIGTAVSAAQDFSNFPELADRTQQGFLHFLFLGRLLRTPDGFVADSAFQASDGTALFDPSDVFYDGNSQGAILGGAVTAVSTEWTRAVLGVPGMNYSTLLQRSVDFDAYLAIIIPAYPDELDRVVAGAITQMLWDRAEANGYAAHMTGDPYPATPAHTVLLHPAFGDHQVANITAEIEARTIGASLRAPGLAPGRGTAVEPFWDIPTIPSFPFGGSAIVMWDSGTPAPPDANLPPRSPDYGDDPHGDPRSTPEARVQKSEFLRSGGAVIEVCGVGPCLTSAHP